MSKNMGQFFIKIKGPDSLLSDYQVLLQRETKCCQRRVIIFYIQFALV